MNDNDERELFFKVIQLAYGEGWITDSEATHMEGRIEQLIGNNDVD